MIAIVGAKGGCGKTTTTLGLAEAFGRAGIPALAIDGDRQLPNLHVLANVERTPTLADLADGGALRTLAQQHPRAANVGILPAPKSSAQVEYEAVLGGIDVEGMQLLIDCPSGAGPDVVESMSVADGVIVATTPSDRSLSAAETSIEMAHRLDVPVLGVVLTQTSEVPSAVEEWKRVPVLGCIPERTSPLLNDEVQDAFDTVIERLQTQNPAERSRPEYDDDLLPMGLEPLDRALGGGLPPGSVVALEADAASQAEHLLYQLTALRGTLYLTTSRSKANVKRAFDSTSVPVGNPTIRRVRPDDPLEHATELVSKLPESATLVVDDVDALERADRSAYQSFLNELKDRMVATDGVAILHGFKRDQVPENRQATRQIADAVFDLHTVSPGVGTDVEHYLSIPKYRHDLGFSETIELDFQTPTDATPVAPPDAD